MAGRRQGVLPITVRVHDQNFRRRGDARTRRCLCHPHAGNHPRDRPTVTHRIGAKPSGSQKASRRPWVRHTAPPDLDFIECAGQIAALKVVVDHGSSRRTHGSAGDKSWRVIVARAATVGSSRQLPSGQTGISSSHGSSRTSWSGNGAGWICVGTLPPTIPGTHWVRSAGSMAFPHQGHDGALPAAAGQRIRQPQQIGFHIAELGDLPAIGGDDQNPAAIVLAVPSPTPVVSQMQRRPRVARTVARQLRSH